MYLPDPNLDAGGSISFDHFVENWPSLRVGQPVIVSGRVQAQSSSQSKGISDDGEACEVVFITAVTPIDTRNPVGSPVTSIEFTPRLVNTYYRETVTVNANVSLATHGETKNEVLGSGDPSKPYLEFVLKNKPLTFVAASTPSGALSTLEVRVNDILWKEVPNLYGIAQGDRSYITRIEDNGDTRVKFGYAKPERGIENIKAKYRVGIGSDGLLEAGQA